jgi:sigma-54 specific flagellar transcriptional regulator A
MNFSNQREITSLWSKRQVCGNHECGNPLVMTNPPPFPLTQAAYTGHEPDDCVRHILAGASASMQQVRAMIRTVAPSTASILICGPTGSGKELVARAIHAASATKDGPFIAINCGAIPAELIESELFGHERGAFTGAVDRRVGRFEAAAGGTLLLDEIGDMPAAAQVRLLRVLEERRFTRVGGTQELRFSGRIIAASHCDLPRLIDDGRFRADLWYRLAVAIITLPPLRERREDIPALVTALSRDIDRPARLDDASLTLLAQHDWPGNVRELRSVLVRAALFHPPGLGPVDIRQLPALIHPTGTLPAHSTKDDEDLRALLYAVERRQMSDALKRAGGIVADAARLTGLNRTTFVEKMRRHGLTRDEATGRRQETTHRTDAPFGASGINSKENATLPPWQPATR